MITETIELGEEELASAVSAHLRGLGKPGPWKVRVDARQELQGFDVREAALVWRVRHGLPYEKVWRLTLAGPAPAPPRPPWRALLGRLAGRLAR